MNKEQQTIHALVKIIDALIPETKGDQPINFATGNMYKGLNAWILNKTKFQSKTWLSHDQITKLGGKIQPNEKPTYIYQRKLADVKNDQGKVMYKITILDPYTVWNIEQVYELQGSEIVKIHDVQDQTV